MSNTHPPQAVDAIRVAFDRMFDDSRSASESSSLLAGALDPPPELAYLPACNVNAAVGDPDSSPINYDDLPVGEHTLEWYALNPSGDYDRYSRHIRTVLTSIEDRQLNLTVSLILKGLKTTISRRNPVDVNRKHLTDALDSIYSYRTEE